MPQINNEILTWARDTAGLSVEHAAKKLALTDKTKRTAADQLEDMESGRTSPSTAMLNRMAKVYRRSLLTFYLSGPPAKASRGHDFRLLPQRHTSDEPLVDVLLRDVRARQSMVRSIVEDDEDASPLPFIGSSASTTSVEQLASKLKDVFSIDIVVYRQQKTAEAAFNYLRTQAESAGVFVLLIGNLGSFHTNLAVAAFRGFALSDELAPFVVVNDQDAKSAWSFTLLHELAHLLLGETGISGQATGSQVEILCNDAASLVLVSQSEMQTIDGVGSDFDADASSITGFAHLHFVSRSMVAYRLFKNGRISESQWSELTEHFRREWYALKEMLKEKQRAKEGTGPDYYVIKRHRLGRALLGFVEREMQAGVLSPTKAAKVLGVKPRSVAPLLSPQRAA